MPSNGVRKTLTPSQPEGVGPNVIGIDDRVSVRARCLISSVSDSSNKGVNSDKNKKAKNNKKKNLDTSRLPYFCQNMNISYNSDKFNDYLYSKDSNAIRDIIVKQQQYQLFYDNLPYIFTNFKIDLKYIFENVEIDITKLDSNLNLEMVKYLSSLDYEFKNIKFKNGVIDLFIYSLRHFDILKYLIDECNQKIKLDNEQINLLWVHSCGFNLIEPLRIMIKNNLTYNFKRPYLNNYDEKLKSGETNYYYTDFKNIKFSKSTILIQIIDNYPSFFNKDIIDFLELELNCKLDNEFNCDYMINNSSNFELFNNFKQWNNSTKISDTAIYIDKIFDCGNYNYCKSLLNFSIDSDIYKYSYKSIIKIFNNKNYNFHSKTFYHNNYIFKTEIINSLRGITGNGFYDANFKGSYLCNGILYKPSSKIFKTEYCSDFKILIYDIILIEFIEVFKNFYKLESTTYINSKIINKINILEKLKLWFRTNSIYTVNSIYKLKYIEYFNFKPFITDIKELNFINNPFIDVDIFYSEYLIKYISEVENSLGFLGPDVLNIIMSY